MNYVSIGTSWITEKFISAAKCNDKINLYGVYSRSSEKGELFRQKMNARICYTSLEDIASDKNVDSVYIASPNRLHFEQSKFFLMRGKNVICEKPATTTEEEMRELISLAEKNGLIYIEAIMSVHTEAFTILKKELDNIGIIRGAHFDFSQLSSKYGLYKEGKNPNIFNPELHTGCLMDIGVYNLYLAAALFGMPEKIMSAAVKLENGADACGSAIFSYKNFVLSLNYSKTGQGYAQSEITGDKATLLISSVSQITGIYKKSASENIKIVDDDIDRNIIMGYEAEFFRKMCETKDYSDKEYIFSKNTALTVRKMCDIIRQQNNFPF